jgi:hypothetical protein
MIIKGGYFEPTPFSGVFPRSHRGESGAGRAFAMDQAAVSPARLLGFHSGTTAFPFCSEKMTGASNLPVFRSYQQRQPLTTPVCIGLRPLMSASPDSVITR